MSGPSFEGFSQKPVVARTMEVAYSNFLNAPNATGTFHQNDALSATPSSTPVVAIEDDVGGTKHIEIDVANKQVKLTPGAWQISVNLVGSSDAVSHRPRISVTNATGNALMLELDLGTVSKTTDPSALSFSATAVYHSTAEILAKLRLGSFVGTDSDFEEISVTFTKLMSA